MRNLGFTLPELLVALGLSAMLLALAAPGLAAQRGEAALRSAGSQLLSVLQLARREALARGQSVTACPSPDGATCSFGSAHWILFANAPGGTNSTRDAPDEILQRWSMPQGVIVGGTRGYAAFQARPGAATTVTFDLCHPAVAQGLSVVVSQTGRPRIVRGVVTASCAGG